MFSNAGKYEPCGIFTAGHFTLIIITIIAIVTALKYSIHKRKEEIYKIIRGTTIIMCILEVIKIIYSMLHNQLYDVNTYLPLYYCSMLLYAGLLSSFTKGKLKRIGDVFLAAGSTIGGIVFIIYPSTSLPTYPMYHFLSIHSFIYHGAMVYLGILVNVTEYIKLKKEDIRYFALLVGIMCFIALIVNYFFDSNLMFISQESELAPIQLLYWMTNGTFIFNLIIMVLQMTVPFYISYYTIKRTDDLHIKDLRKCEI